MFFGSWQWAVTEFLKPPNSSAYSIPFVYISNKWFFISYCSTQDRVVDIGLGVSLRISFRTNHCPKYFCRMQQLHQKVPQLEKRNSVLRKFRDEKQDTSGRFENKVTTSFEDIFFFPSLV